MGRPGTTRTAEHRPAARRRRFRHDSPLAVELFSGFGGLTKAIEDAGFTEIMAANHNRYKVEVHEKNHPDAEHWIADLVDPESADYHSARDLPAGDILVAGVSCTNHTQANTTRAYEQGLTLFDLDDPQYNARVTRSERDRATANCVLHYAQRHHPRLILVECTTELASWGPAIPGRRKVGDGSTYRWWLKQFTILGYKYKILYLNSMFFGVGQSRDRWFGCFWDRRLPAPDLEHRPPSWCSHCEQIVEAVWTWRTGVPATGRVRYGEQYNYRCPRCRTEVIPPMTPSLTALDLTDLGSRIGDRKTPYAAATMARAERCRQRFAEFPLVVVPASLLNGPAGHPWRPLAGQAGEHEAAAAMTGAVFPAHRHNGDGKHLSQPMDTVTTTHEKALLITSTGVIIGAAGHTYERPGSDCRSRGLDQPLWTQSATNTTSLLTPPFAVAVNNYQGGPRGVHEPLPTQGSSETLGLLSTGLITAGGTIKNNGAIGEAKYRAHPLSDPLGTLVGSSVTQGLLFGGWYKQNGSAGTETAPHPLSDPLGTLTARDTTALLFAELAEAFAAIPLDDCYARMLGPHEVGRGCGFDVSFPGYGYEGTFIVWGSAKDQIDGYGNAVSPQVGAWIGLRMRAILDTPEAAA
jgi:site-specific DNA-cytosine methylase